MTNAYTESVLKVLAYFDVFNYPVKLDEIKYFLDQPVTEKKLDFALQQLQDQQLAWRIGDFYCLKNDIAIVQRRLQGNASAVKQLKRAMLVARILKRFPYVKGVAVSGSLSKNVAYEGSDLDFFLIMQKDRLWIGRTILLVPSKIISWLGKKHWACLNYYIDEDALEVKEQNIFTATEIATLLPVLHCGDIFRDFFYANQWTYHFLPNHKPRFSGVKTFKPGVLRRLVEWIFDHGWGDILDNKITKIYERRSFALENSGKRNDKGFPLGAVAGKHECRPFPHHFPKRVLAKFEDKMSLLTSRRKQVLDN